MIKVKIVDTYLNKNLISDNKALKDGVFIRAKVSEINGESVIIILDSGEILEAKTILNLETMKNQLITFLVKNNEDGKLFLTPINQEDLIKFNNDISKDEVKIFIAKVLDAYKLPKSDENELIVKTILNFKMPVTQENVTNVIKNVDKLKSLLDIQQGEKVYKVNSEASTLDESIMKLIKVSSDSKIVTNTYENETIYSKIKNNNMENDNQIRNRGYLDFTEVTDIIYSKLKAIYPEDVKSINIINKVVFLMQLGYDVSLKNIERLTNLLDNGEGIIKPLSDLIDYLKNNVENNNDFLKKNNDIFDKANLNLIRVDDNIIQKKIKIFVNEFSRLTDKVLSSVTTKKNISEELRIKLDDLFDSVEFHNKINSFYNFVHIPIKFSGEDNNSNVFILKKKNKLKKHSYSIYISLNTQNLKKVDIFCNIDHKSINLDFIVDKTFITYFSSKFDYLRKSLKNLGYQNVFIDFKERKEKDIIDIFFDDELFNYNLNVRV